MSADKWPVRYRINSYINTMLDMQDKVGKYPGKWKRNTIQKRLTKYLSIIDFYSKKIKEIEMWAGRNPNANIYTDNFWRTMTITRDVISNAVNNYTKETWFIGDNHFDHTNIIKYCSRPFLDANGLPDVDQMNEVMVKRWNAVVQKEDTVYHLGDVGKISTQDFWLKKLNGRIIFIEGNHDARKSNFYLTIKINDNDVLLTHNPDKFPNWQGWMISGHHHNNHLEQYPLVNYKTKRINVSVELINYTPISLAEIIKLIEKPQIIEEPQEIQTFMESVI